MTTATLDERIIDSAIGALELFSVHLGRSLGLYEALEQPRSVAELAATADIDARYSREWLEQQAVAGFVAVDDPERAKRFYEGLFGWKMESLPGMTDYYCFRL